MIFCDSLFKYANYRDYAKETNFIIFPFHTKSDLDMELVTPPLGTGVILPGVTRQSVLELTREMKGIEVKNIIVITYIRKPKLIKFL